MTRAPWSLGPYRQTPVSFGGARRRRRGASIKTHPRLGTRGRLLLVVADLWRQILIAAWGSRAGGRKVDARHSNVSVECLRFLGKLAEAGKFRPVIDDPDATWTEKQVWACEPAATKDDRNGNETEDVGRACRAARPAGYRSGGVRDFGLWEHDRVAPAEAGPASARALWSPRDTSPAIRRQPPR
jgi:hypothetical protein